MPDGQAKISRLGAQTLLTRLTVYGFGAITSIIISRVLGPEGRGKYFLPVTFITVAYLVSALGTPQAIFRRRARQEESIESLLSLGLLLSVGLSIIGASAVFLVYQLGRKTTFASITPSQMIVVIPVLPFLIQSSMITPILNMSGRLPRVNIATATGAAAQMIGTAALAATGRLTVTSVLVLYGASIIVPWTIMFPSALSLGKLRLSVPIRMLIDHVGLGIQLAPASIFSFLNLRIDVFFVAHYLGAREVGIYSVAVIFAELVWLATDSLSTAVTERQANAPQHEALDVTERAVRMSLTISTILGLSIATLAPFAISLAYGPAFSPAGRVVWALVPAAIAMGAWRSMSSSILRLGSTRVLPLFSLTAVTTNILGNIVLVPRYGIVGAGLASTISYGSGAILAATFLVRKTSLTLGRLRPGRSELRQLAKMIDIRRVLKDPDVPR